MIRIGRSHRIELAILVLAVVALALQPALVEASSHEGSTVADEIKAVIKAGNQYARENLKAQEGGISKEGALQFWSSGGLMQWVPADAPITEYESISIDAKHIKVIELPGGEAAVAMYYSEGSMHPKGSAPVGHYMTRVLEVYVKEDGNWVVRAAHWSPIAAGSGTSQTSID